MEQKDILNKLWRLIRRYNRYIKVGLISAVALAIAMLPNEVFGIEGLTDIQQRVIDSLEVLTGCKVEASLADAKAPASYQFMRLGYFCPDSKDCTPEHLVFNRSVSLKDSFKPGK